ncbi:MAG: hypothetical protein H6607_07945 [Flavobacteriales bacterium]|nr:hypothetical protein [Flavobacteriales bacterium]
MALVYLKHSEIDKTKWDNCIENAPNSMPYALSWYLDIVAKKQWDALILNDYEAVMPLPFNNKLFGFSQIYRPILTQQLGVFGQFSVQELSVFFDNIPNNFKLIRYPINYKNSNISSETKTNLVLDLLPNFELVKSNFSHGLKMALIKYSYQISETGDTDKLIEMYKTELENTVKFGKENYALAKKLFSEIIRREMGKIYQLTVEDKTVAMAFILSHNNRHINLFSISRYKKQYRDSMGFLLAKIIEKKCYQMAFFDFEGSEIDGIKKFFLSFGATPQPYYFYTKNTLPFWLKWLRS